MSTYFMGVDDTDVLGRKARPPGASPASSAQRSQEQGLARACSASSASSCWSTPRIPDTSHNSPACPLVPRRGPAGRRRRVSDRCGCVAGAARRVRPRALPGWGGEPDGDVVAFGGAPAATWSPSRGAYLAAREGLRWGARRDR